MSEVNKKYNRRIRRPCPVCGGRVVVGHRTCSWWVYCEENSSHIPQLWFSYPNDAINQWNLKANRVTNADKLRAMSDEEMASKLASFRCPFDVCFPEGGENCKKCWLD